MYKVCVSFKCDLPDNKNAVVNAFVSSYIPVLDKCPIDKHALMSVLATKLKSKTLDANDIEVLTLGYLLQHDQFADKIRNPTEHTFFVFYVQLSDDNDGSADVAITQLDYVTYKQHINDVKRVAMKH